MERKFRHVLASSKDIQDELNEQLFVRGCKVIENSLGQVIIKVRLPIIDLLFRSKKRLDQIHTILRPKMLFTVTYELKLIL